MLAVGGYHCIVRCQDMQSPHRNRLLTDIQMQEATDLAFAIKLGGALLQAADAHHVVQ